ncbi:hypothetical protein MRX96_042134 [Rhipicephalus microplus]
MPTLGKCTVIQSASSGTLSTLPARETLGKSARVEAGAHADSLPVRGFCPTGGKDASLAATVSLAGLDDSSNSFVVGKRALSCLSISWFRTTGLKEVEITMQGPLNRSPSQTVISLATTVYFVKADSQGGYHCYQSEFLKGGCAGGTQTDLDQTLLLREDTSFLSNRWSRRNRCQDDVEGPDIFQASKQHCPQEEHYQPATPGGGMSSR